MTSGSGRCRSRERPARPDDPHGHDLRLARPGSETNHQRDASPTSGRDGRLGVSRRRGRTQPGLAFAPSEAIRSLLSWVAGLPSSSGCHNRCLGLGHFALERSPTRATILDPAARNPPGRPWFRPLGLHPGRFAGAVGLANRDDGGEPLTERHDGGGQSLANRDDGGEPLTERHDGGGQSLAQRDDGGASPSPSGMMEASPSP